MRHRATTKHLPAWIYDIARRAGEAHTEEKSLHTGCIMNLNELFTRLENEFQIEIPEADEAKLASVRDLRDYIREAYREQSMELPAGLIFERLRRLIALVALVDASDVKPESRLADIGGRVAAGGWR